MNLSALIAAGEIDPARSIHWLWPAAAELIYGSLASILIFGLLFPIALLNIVAPTKLAALQERP